MKGKWINERETKVKGKGINERETKKELRRIKTVPTTGGAGATPSLILGKLSKFGLI